MLIALIVAVVCIDRIFHIPAFGWLLLQWLRASAWVNGHWGINSIFVIVLPLFSLAVKFIPSVNESDEMKKAFKYIFSVLCVVAGLVLALYAFGGAFNITLVPNIQRMHYEGAKDKCEAVGLYVPEKEEWQGNSITFQFPSAGSIISKGAFVYAAETFDYFVKKNTTEVDRLFLTDEEVEFQVPRIYFSPEFNSTSTR